MAAPAAGMARIFHQIEESAGSGWRWLLLLCVWIVARNLTESILEPPHEMGFDWRGDVSFAMFFLHYPLFYLTLFAGALLWIRWLARRPLSAVAGLMSVGYGLLLVAPLVDALTSAGRGYDLHYMAELGSVLWRFWDPRVSLPSVSPGQRIEILLACLLCFLYVYAMRRQAGGSAARAAGPALLGLAGLFLWVAFLGAWPSLFARLTSSGSDLPMEAYTRVMRGPGLIPGETRRLALIVALPILILLPACAAALDRVRFGVIVRSLSWTRLIHYTGLLPAGVFLGWLIYADHLSGMFTNPVDAVAVVVLWGGMVAAYLASVCWNDLHDQRADAINEPDRPLPSGAWEPAGITALARAGALIALYLSLCVSYPAFLLMLACLLLSWLYSTPPVRLKRWPLVATFTLALLSVLSLATGFSLFAREMTPQVFPRGLALFLLLGITLGFAAKDLKDARGDRKTGVVTLATLLPDRGARTVAALLVAGGYLLAPVFLSLESAFVWTAAAFALVSAVLALRVKRPDRWLLGIFLLFALCLAIFLARRPDALRMQVPAPLRELAGQTRGIEEGIRGVRGEAERAGVGGVREEERRLAARLRRAFDLIPAAYAGAEEGPAARSARRRLQWARAQLAPAGEIPAADLQRDLTELLEDQPLRAQYWDALADAARRAGDHRRALELCSEATALGIRPGDFLRNRAALRIEAGFADGHGLDLARRDLAGAFLLGQQRTLLWVLLGDLLLRCGDAAQAIPAYRRALAMEPRRADGWDGLGQALHAAGRWPEAVAALEEAHTLDPQDPWVLNNLGVALRAAGRPRDAQRRFLLAHRLAPDLFDPLYNLALTADQLGEVQEARQWIERARELRPGFAPLEDALRRGEERSR